MPVIPAGALTFQQLAGRSSADPLAGDLAGDGSVRVVRIPPGQRTPHRHPNSAEIVYVAEGHGVAWEHGTRTPIAAGDLIAIPRGVPHATAAAAEGLVLVCFFPTPTVATEELDAPRISL